MSKTSVSTNRVFKLTGCVVCGLRACVVGDHARDGPEEGVQVVGELRAACVAGVHRDEDPKVGRPPHHLALKLEDGLARDDGLLDGDDLLRDDAEDLDVDAVELVEAGPRSGLDEAGEEAALSSQTTASVS